MTDIEVGTLLPRNIACMCVLSQRVGRNKPHWRLTKARLTSWVTIQMYGPVAPANGKRHSDTAVHFYRGD